MDHALTFAIIAGLLGLTLLGALLLRQGIRMSTSVETMRAALTTSGLSARSAGRPAALHGGRFAEAADRTSSGSQEDPDAPIESDPPEHEDPLVIIPTFDFEGRPHHRSVRLSTLLRGVGISTPASEPGLEVVAHAQCEIRAIAQLARNLGTHNSEDIDFSDIGLALEGISHRLEVADVLLDSVQETQARAASEAPPAAEPPSSDDPDPSDA